MREHQGSWLHAARRTWWRPAEFDRSSARCCPCPAPHPLLPPPAPPWTEPAGERSVPSVCGTLIGRYRARPRLSVVSALVSSWGPLASRRCNRSKSCSRAIIIASPTPVYHLSAVIELDRIARWGKGHTHRVLARPAGTTAHLSKVNVVHERVAHVRTADDHTPR